MLLCYTAGLVGQTTRVSGRRSSPGLGCWNELGAARSPDRCRDLRCNLRGARARFHQHGNSARVAPSKVRVEVRVEVGVEARVEVRVDDSTTPVHVDDLRGICPWPHAHMRACMRARVRTHTCIDMHAHVHAHVHEYMCMCISSLGASCPRRAIYIYTSYIYIYIHTCASAPSARHVHVELVVAQDVSARDESNQLAVGIDHMQPSSAALK